jgi:hypothetical protein
LAARRGEDPICEAGFQGYRTDMKNKQKKYFTLGDFIVAAYQVWGADEAERMVRSAINSHLLVFRDQTHVWIASGEGRTI